MSTLRKAWGVLAEYRQAARQYGTSLPFVLRRGVRLKRWRGFRFREALREGLLDPSLPDEVLAACISKERLISLQTSVNAPARECLTEDKAAFYPYCKGLGLPVPELYAVLGQTSGYTAGGRALAGREAWTAFLARDLPEPCVVKPAFGYYGLGVRVLRRVAGEFLDQTGRRLAPDALYDELASERAFRKFVFQERLAQHPELLRLSGTPAVQTARMVTWVDAGKAECNHAFLRIAVGGNAVDNFRDGKTGNLIARIDLVRGQIRDSWGSTSDGVGLARVALHPGTGVSLAGFRLPFWAEARSVVEKAAILFLPMRCIGWDVAFTPSGPVIVEANMWWDPSNLFGVDPSPAGPGLGPLALLLERLTASARRGAVDPKG